MYPRPQTERIAYSFAQFLNECEERMEIKMATDGAGIGEGFTEV